MNTPRSPPPSPPARGSFPLDHAGACAAPAARYLACLRARAAAGGGPPGASGADASSAGGCDLKALSRAYLECRMAAGLMAEEDLNRLGFSPAALQALAAPPAPPAQPAQPAERVAGLAALRAAKGGGAIAFGLALPKPAPTPAARPPG